jgi:hypothetical protein
MRPRPPKKLLESFQTEFVPAPELDKFVRESFLNEESKLYNYDHRHLRKARIGYLWTNAGNMKQMKTVVGTAEIPKPSPMSSMWQKARYYYQIREWFGTTDLDFLITLDAVYISKAPNNIFLAILDHELYHCGHKRDEFGKKLFSKQTGKPIFGLLGHDVEEFVGIWMRYGPRAGAGDSMKLLIAGKSKPLIGKADIQKLCGNS